MSTTTHALMPDGRKTVCGRELAAELDAQGRRVSPVPLPLYAVRCRHCWARLRACTQLQNQLLVLEKERTGGDIARSVYAGPRERRDRSGAPPEPAGWTFAAEPSPAPSPPPARPPEPPTPPPAPSSPPSSGAGAAGLCPACGRNVPVNAYGRTHTHHRPATGRLCSGGIASHLPFRSAARPARPTTKNSN